MQDASAARGDAAPGLPLAPWRPRDLSGRPRDPRIRGRSDLFWAKKNQTHHPPPRHQPATRPTRPPPYPKPPQTNHTPQAPHARRAGTQAPRAPNARGRAHTRARAQKAKKNSAIGTRTRVSWVKAKYDNSRVFSYRQKHTYTIAEQLSIGKNAALSCLRLVKRAAD